MPGLETTLGGSREAFPETVWSSVLSGAEKSPAAVNRLFQMYWRPVYKFIRTAGGATIEDAKDLTQEFFAYLLEGDVISKYEGEKGRFRTFLKGVLRNFLSESRRDASRLKRGGGKAILSLDVSGLETESVAAEKGQAGPEEQFDRQWATDVITQCLAKLRRQLEAEGKSAYYQVYESYYSGDGRPTYGRVAVLFGLTEQNVKNYLEVARARFEDLIRARLIQGVTSFDDLSEEISALLSR